MSGGGGGTQNTVSKFEPPAWAQTGWENATNAAGALAQTPYQQYGGMTIAPWNADQNAASDMIYQSSTLGAPDVNTGRGTFTNIAAGAGMANPYSTDAYAQKVIGQNANTMADAFARGTAAQNDALFARSGAYGGSAWQQKQEADAAGLDKQIGDMANNYQLQNQSLGMNDYRSGIGQMLQGAQGALQGQGLDQSAANALMNMGTAKNDYTNRLLQQLYGEYQMQMNYPQSQLQNYLNALTQSSGGGQGTTTTSGPGNSPWANLLGGGLAAAGAYNLFKG